MLQLTRGVAQSFGTNAEPVEQSEVEIGEGRPVGIHDMAAALDGTAAATGHQYRKIVVVMPVPVTNASAEHDHGIIKQSTVRFFDRLKLFQEVGELCHLEVIDLFELLLLFRHPAVMREVMMSFGNADLAK